MIHFMQKNMARTEEEEEDIGPDTKKIFVPQNDEPILSSLIEEPVGAMFLDYLLFIMEDTRKNWKQFHQYFRIFSKTLTLGFKIKRHLLYQSLIARLIDFYMGHHSPLWRNVGKERVPIGNLVSEIPNLNDHMSAFRAAVISCHNGVSEEKKSFPDKELHFLTKLDNQFLFNNEFYNSILKQCYSLEANRDITLHICYDDKRNTSWMLERLFSSISRARVDQLNNVLIVFSDLLSLQDSIRMWRVPLLISADHGILICLDSLLVEFYNVLHLLHMFLEKIKSDPVVAGYICFLGKKFENKIHRYFKGKIRELEHIYLNTYLTDHNSQLIDVKEEYKCWRKLFLHDMKFIDISYYPKDFTERLDFI